MARARSQDFLLVSRFKVVEIGSVGEPKLVVAGFTSIDIPTFSVEEAIYREGTYKFTKKQPGIPTFDNATLRKGIARLNSKFYDWIRSIVDGKEYRADITIYHFHGEEDPRSDDATRVYTLKEAFPVVFTPSSSLDATASDVAIEELQIAFEELVVEQKKVGAQELT